MGFEDNTGVGINFKMQKGKVNEYSKHCQLSVPNEEKQQMTMTGSKNNKDRVVQLILPYIGM